MSKDENKKKKDVKNNGRFFKESKAELKKVSWPKPKALATDTATVLIIVLVVAAIVAVLDLGFMLLNKNVIIKTEEKIINSRSIEEIENPTEESNNSENEGAEEGSQNPEDGAEENSEAEVNE